MQCRQPEISCQPGSARFIIPPRPRDISEDTPMCAFGGITRALGAAAVACAMISPTQAEPVSYDVGDLSVTQLDGVDVPPKLNWSNQHVDTEVADTDDNRLASFDRASSCDG